jgi:cytochrome c oxidase subunit IV
MLPEWMLDLQFSDYLMFIFMLATLWFVVDYGGFTGWWRHPVGWILLGFPISVGLLLTLIIYGVVFGQRVDEIYRIPVMALLVIMMIGKIVAVHISRREGRLERRRQAYSRQRREAAFLNADQGDHYDRQDSH